MTLPLTNLDETKAYLKIPLTEYNDEKLIESLINAASSAIESYCGRKFHEQTYTDEEYDGNGSKYILLEQYPVSFVSSVSIDGNALSTSDFKVKKNNGMLIRTNGIWPQGDINISVTYSAGYTKIPSDVEQACKDLVLSKFNTDLRSFSTTFQEGFVFRAEAFPAQVKAWLAPYKKVM